MIDFDHVWLCIGTKLQNLRITKKHGVFISLRLKYVQRHNKFGFNVIDA
jgi:hypothetical protein